MREGGVSRLLTNLVTIVHSSESLEEPSSFEEAYERVWYDAMEIGLKPTEESWIDSKLAVDGSVIEYRDRDVGFSQAKGVELDDILALRFSKKEGVDLAQINVSDIECFEVHERDSHIHKLTIAMHGLLIVP